LPSHALHDTIRPGDAMAADNAATPAEAINAVPAAADNLRLDAPLSSWEDAIPLGNGLMGALVWGEGKQLRFSLDRGDLWDERTHGEPEWWKKHPWGTLTMDNIHQNPDPWGKYYNGATPTKLPSGRLELQLADGQVLDTFELDLATAQGLATTKSGATIHSLVSAADPVALIKVKGSPVLKAVLVPAGESSEGAESFSNTHSGGAVAALGYPAAARGSAGTMNWYVQDGVDGFSYCACVAVQEQGRETLVAVAMTTSAEASPEVDLLQLAKDRCTSALAAGYEETLNTHAAWWAEFWAQSAISLPEQMLQRNYQFNRYLYGAGSRKNAPPMPLQGVWTADNGGLPPWKGDYHNDLNTQLTYGAYQQAGHWEAGESYLDFLWDLTPVFEDFARDFYGTQGLSSPGVMTLSGQPLGGWSHYAMSPTMSAWNAHLFYLHWRYTKDNTFLTERAYPWVSEVGQCLEDLLTVNDDGVLVLPLSSSPEAFDNTLQAWLKPNSNYDLMSLKMLFLALAEMAQAQSLGADRLKWLALSAQLGDFHAADGGELLLDADTALEESHRHLSNIIGIHPFNLITVDGSETDRQRIEASLKAWDALGTAHWTGYTWAWMGCLRARVGDGEEAARHVGVYAEAFVSRNGFHINGDQSGKGYSGFTYRPFTLEGNFAAMQAIQEMLLQSWSPTPGVLDSEVIRLFPAVPNSWADASFNDLRTEGGHRVCAWRENGTTIGFSVIAGSDGAIRIRDNFGGNELLFDVDGVRKDGIQKQGQDFVLMLQAGAKVTVTIVEKSLEGTASGEAGEPEFALSRG